MMRFRSLRLATFSSNLVDSVDLFCIFSTLCLDNEWPNEVRTAASKQVKPIYMYITLLCEVRHPTLEENGLEDRLPPNSLLKG